MSIVKKLLVMVGMVVIGATSVTSYAATTTGSTTTYVKDSAITADVKAKLLADSDVKSMHISVKTNHHKVTLSGHVDTADQKDKAGSIASAVEGVTSVDNKITVKPAKS